jgi:hypothetical protein
MSVTIVLYEWAQADEWKLYFSSGLNGSDLALNSQVALA